MPLLQSQSTESLRNAVLFASGAAIVLPIMDGMIKLLVASYPVFLIAWWRFGVMSALLVGIGARQQGWRQFKTRSPMLQVLRAAMIVVASACFYTGLRRLPLAECTAIMFLAPALSALLGYLFLRERPDRWAWAVIALSMIGAFIVIRPGGRMFDSAALFVLVGTCAYAVFSMVTRILAQRDAPQVTTLWSALGAFGAFSLVVPGHWAVRQSAEHLVLVLLIGVFGTAGQFLFSLAYRHGHTHVIAPLTYLSLPVALAVGWLMFGEIPDLWSFAGMAMIGSAALMVALGHTTREA
jgi:drug/metabolite transporter (DMT)-like permease